MTSGRPWGRVLILEDEVLIAMELQAIVEEFGCEAIGPAARCEAALELLGSHHVDAAILDLMIGDQRCDSVAAELTARGVPWALATGFDPEAVENFHRGVPRIAKPYVEDEIRDTLRALLSSGQSGANSA